MAKARHIDIFCGMGALSLGWEAAGSRPKLGVDIVKHAAITYAANRPGVPTMLCDVAKLDPVAVKRVIGDADIITGGVPCEPFSTARHNDPSRGSDPRKHLIRAAMRWVEVFKPKAFVFENVVPAVKSPQWKLAIAAIQRNGYGVSVWKLIASEHGVPQMRRRIFLVGIRGGEPDALDPPDVIGEVAVHQAIADLGEPSEGGKDPLHFPPSKFSPRAAAAIARTKPGGSLADSGTGWVWRNNKVLDPDKPSWTITTAVDFVHWNKKRWLTLREIARIQTIPDGYKFPVKRSKIREMLGDVVPVKLATAVAKKVMSHITKCDGTAEVGSMEELVKSVTAVDEYDPDHDEIRPKQKDPFLVVPDEGKQYRYVVQHHWRGKGVHSDFRIQQIPGKLLIGWTMNTQIAGAVKEPVVTLTQARRVARRMGEISKVNWDTGEWATRERRGADKPVRTEILSEAKAPNPHAWLDVEGKTKDPEPGKPPPVGGTSQFPGVFHIVDKGVVEYGAQKPWVHEYFVRGDAMSYRLIFRRLQLNVQKAVHAHNQCMDCKSKPDWDVIWGPFKARAWFCDEHFEAWKKAKAIPFLKETVTFEQMIVDVKRIKGAAPAEFGEVHKAMVAKAVLPPSEPEAGRHGTSQWLAIRPDDLMPMVLDSEQVKKGWMPPAGVSALPKAVRRQVPAEHRYWEEKTAAKAKEMRDALVAAIKDGEVKIDFAAPYKRATKRASMLDARFALQEQVFRGPVQIRVGPSSTLWWLRLNVGRPKLVAVQMYDSPLDNEQAAADVQEDSHRDSIGFEGAAAPGHYLNPTKKTPSAVAILDEGKAKVLSMSDDLIRLELDGDKLKGLFSLVRNDGEWLWKPGGADSDVEKRDESTEQVDIYVPIIKVEREKRHITGVVLEPGVIDAHEDIISEETVEKSAHRFLARFNDKTKLGLMHKVFGDIGVELVESWVAPVEFKLNGHVIKKGTWLMKTKVNSTSLWRKVKEGKITGYSIGGTAKV